MPFLNGLYNRQNLVSALKEYTIYIGGQNASWRDKGTNMEKKVRVNRRKAQQTEVSKKTSLVAQTVKSLPAMRETRI